MVHYYQPLVIAGGEGFSVSKLARAHGPGEITKEILLRPADPPPAGRRAFLLRRAISLRQVTARKAMWGSWLGREMAVNSPAAGGNAVGVQGSQAKQVQAHYWCGSIYLLLRDTGWCRVTLFYTYSHTLTPTTGHVRPHLWAAQATGQ
jgi:hypothetical protein